MELDGLEVLCGVAEEVVYRREDTGFTVVDISTDDGELITVVGVLPDIGSGEDVKFYGRWDTHASFGRQFRAESCERSLPGSAAQMLKYLSSGTVKGIGPSIAVKLVNAFGADTFDVLENHPEKLAKIRGISKEMAERISRQFAEQTAVRDIIVRLEALGLSPNESLTVYKVFGQNSVKYISENPYLLCLSEIGMRFERADDIASSMPEPANSEYRTKAGIVHVVSHNLSNGHTCLPREKLLAPCADLLSTDKDTIDITIDALVEERRLKCIRMDTTEFIFLPHIFDAEHKAAQRMKMMVTFPPAGRHTLTEEIEKIEKINGIAYEELQRKAIVTAVEKGLLILTGGPGTGKTTTVNGILELFERDGLNVVLTAPTGRAAQRMSEITGKEAKTIHRLLEAERTGGEKLSFCRDERNPIDADVVIVDELSMVDIVLFSALLSALPLGCRLIMVGDTDQLPPVGAGNVLNDLLESGIIPVVRLDEVFRQAMQSLIVTNAHRIVRGENPVLDQVDNDFFHLERESASVSAGDILSLYRDRLPRAYGYDPIKNIQVLCPSKKGDTGSVNLNRLLQGAVNPPSKAKDEIKLSAKTFRVGDKVMQIKNDYGIVWRRGKEEGEGIFNGDVGILIEINKSAGILKIDFDGRIAEYPASNLGELELAYAITVHKSQGSEFDAVIMPVIDIPPQLCYRNLFYTAVTRAKSKMITIGRRRQIQDMVENDRKIKRYSALKYFLKVE